MPTCKVEGFGDLIKEWWQKYSQGLPKFCGHQEIASIERRPEEME